MKGILNIMGATLSDLIGVRNYADKGIKDAENAQRTADIALSIAEEAMQIITDTSKQLITPSLHGNLTYNGEIQRPTWLNYDTEQIAISGVIEAKDVGRYIANFTPKGLFRWRDGTVTSRSVEWTISPMPITLPSQAGELFYTGGDLSPIWDNSQTDRFTISGVTIGKNAGVYQAIFTPTNNFSWEDGTRSEKSISWKISRAKIKTPYQANFPIYTGNEIVPSWSEYDNAKISISGDTKGLNAGTYQAIFKPNENYQWQDGTTKEKAILWTIAKDRGSLNINKSSILLDIEKAENTISVTRAGNGTISAISSNPNVATVSINAMNIEIVARGKGDADITISVSEGTNHTKADNRVCKVSVDFPSKILSENTPEMIQKTARAGRAAEFWKIGDKTERISLDFGDASNRKYFLNQMRFFHTNTSYPKGSFVGRIIGFNHNAGVEGENSIHFEATDFVDDAYPNTSCELWWKFKINTVSTDSLGIVSDLNEKYHGAVEKRWLDVISNTNKQRTRSGYENPSQAEVYDERGFLYTETGKFFTLGAIELLGRARVLALDRKKTENNKLKYYTALDSNQAQYTYFVNGNDKRRSISTVTGNMNLYSVRDSFGTYIGNNDYEYELQIDENGNATNVQYKNSYINCGIVGFVIR